MEENAYTLWNEASAEDIFYLQFLGNKELHIVYTSEKEDYPVTVLTIERERLVASSKGAINKCLAGCDTHIEGCDIKGNISVDSGEKIYHMPGQKYYDNTKISPEYGERWFCTEEEAQANGWRKAKQ